MVELSKADATFQLPGKCGTKQVLAVPASRHWRTMLAIRLESK